MYCQNCGKELENNSKFCSNCGFEIIQTKQAQIRTEKQSISKLGFLLCIIVPLVLYIIYFIIGKVITGINNLFLRSILKTIIYTFIKVSFLTGLLFACNEITKKKKILSILSIIVSCLYIVYCIITSSLSFIKFLNNKKKEIFDIIYAVSNIMGVLFLLVGFVFTLIFIFRQKQVLRTVIIILFGLAVTSSAVYSTFSLIQIKKLLNELNEINNITSSVLKSYNDNSKKTGTWIVYLRYDDPDQKYSKYDNLYSKRSRFCDKEYAIQNAKEWLLIDHPRARNIYIDDCIFEGYSTSPID